MTMKTVPSKQNAHWLGMVFATFAVIQLDALAAVIPHQVLSMGITPVVWGIGAAVLWSRARSAPAEDALYRVAPFSPTDALILFFVSACGAAMALSSFVYGGLRPLFIRELCTGYPLYTLRNLLYYPLEVLLMLELLIYGQKAGEALTKSSLPWGALALFVLWGLPHILWHGIPDGLVSACRAFPYSVPFYASCKHAGTSYLSMLILWFL